MPTYTVPNDIVEDLVAAYRGVVPADIGDPNRADNSDDVYALAEMMAIAECVAHNWGRMALVAYADGAYLELLARGGSVFKQSGETDDQLRGRIRTPPLAIAPDLILEALQQIVDAAGSGQVFLIELPRDAAYFEDSYCDRNSRLGSAVSQVVIALVPASAGVLTSTSAALASKASAGKVTLVQEYASP